MPKMSYVKSESIKMLGYDKQKQTLYLKFVNGNMYEYYNVPEEEFEKLKSAESIGAYFNKHFREYEYKKIED